MEGLFGLIDNKLKQPLPLEKVNVDVRVKGLTASILSELQYNNIDEKPVEVIFLFPLEDTVSVCGFQVKIEDRIIKGKVEEKEEARDTYDDAISSGKSVFLLEESKDSSDIFRISVGNLPGKTTAAVQIQCVSLLKSSKDGSLTFTLPSVMNPRYCPESQIEKGDNWTVKSHQTPSVRLPYVFSFKMQLEVGSEIEKIHSDTDKLNVTIDSGDRRKALVNLDGDFECNHDIEVVVIQKSPFSPHVFIEKGKLNLTDQTEATSSWEENFQTLPVVMVNFLPKFPSQSFADSKNAGEFIFVIDRSGSMSGSKINDATEALLLFLKSLPENSVFDIISFGSTFKSFFGRSKKYSDANVTKACHFVKSIKADMGGTEILEPLKHIYKRNKENGNGEKMVQNVFLLTDGEVSNSQRVIDLVKMNAGRSRCFSLGIGHGASTALVNGVAKAGRGLADFVRSGERLQKKVICMLEKACQPRAENIGVKWEVSNSLNIKQIPETIDFIFDDGFLVVYGVVTNAEATALKGDVILEYEVEGKNHENKLTFNVNNSDDPEEARHFSLHALAAKDYITQCNQSNDSVSPPTLKDTVTQLSKTSGVISKYTSYVAVDGSTQVPVQGPLICHDANDPMDVSSRSRSRSQRRSRSRSRSRLQRRPRSRSQSRSRSRSRTRSRSGSRSRSRSPYKPRSRGPYHASRSPSPYQPRSRECRRALHRSPELELAYQPRFRARDRSPERSQCRDQARFYFRASPCYYPTSPGNYSPPGYSPATYSRNSVSKHVGLIDLQSVSGNWALTKEFSAVLGKKRKDFLLALPQSLSTVSSEVCEKESVWATVLAVIWLKSQEFQSVQDELRMIIEKAEKWLLSHLPAGVTRDELAQDARNVLA